MERGAGGSPDLLVVQHQGNELLIPFVKAFIVQSNLAANVLRMRLPAGLTAINAPLSDEERAAQQRTNDEDKGNDAL